MQRTTSSQRSRLRPARRGLARGSGLPAALLTASALMLAAAPAATAQSGGWSHYEVAAPKVITLDFDTDLLAWDLCWSDHTAMTRTRIANAAVAQMNDPARLHVIDIPGLPPFYRRTSNASIWYDLEGERITSSSVLPNRWNYHIDVEQALIDIAAQIREARPGAKLAFKNFEVQPLYNREAAYTALGEVQDFYITDRTIYLNHVGHMLNHALNSAFYRARVDFAGETANWLVFPDAGGKFALASTNGLDWPPAEFEPEILALWGGDDEPESGGGGGGGEVPVDTGNILSPGSGFSENWGEFVSAVGAEHLDGYDAKAIARWNVVPYQTVEDEPFSVGVVAFHINEIERVDFYLEGGPAVTTTEMRHNPRTDTWEYWAVLDPDVFQQLNYPDGPIELRAVAYPRFAGQPRELEPLMLNTNSNATLPKPVRWCAPWGNDETGDGTEENPFRQPYRAMRAAYWGGGAEEDGADGAIVYLLPGEYHWGDGSWPPKTLHRWATVKGAPGTQPSDIVFSSSSPAGFKTNLIAISGVTFDSTSPTTALGGPRGIWMDNCVFLGPGRDSSFRLYHASQWSSGVYVTNCELRHMRDGFQGTRLVRSAHLEDLGSDAFGDSALVVNCSVDGIDSSGTDFHPDVYQFSGGTKDNYIVYGLNAVAADAQGIFSDDCPSVNNVAFVNVHIALPLGRDPLQPGFSQWITPSNHLLLHNITLPNSVFVFRSDSMANVSVAGNVFYRVTTAQKAGHGPPVIEDGWFRGNHFINTYSLGSLILGDDVTVGDPRFIAPDTGDFTPRADSPLRMRLSDALSPIDINGEERSTPDTVGAIR